MPDLNTEVVRYRHWVRFQPFLNALKMLGMAALVLLVVMSYRQASGAEAQKVMWVAQAKGLGEQIAKSDVCTSTDPADVAQFGYLCDQARKVKDQPEPREVDTRALASAVSAVVMASLPARVEAAVSKYMGQHPTASRDEVRDWVRQEVAATPPVPGPAGQPGKDGDRGPTGPAGPAPTDAQIDAAVTRWFSDHPPNVCPGVWVPRLAPDGTSYYRCEVPVPLPPS